MRIWAQIAMITSSLLVQAQKTKIEFDVFLNNKHIGELTATSEKKDSMVIKDVCSNTDAKVMMLSVHVESEVQSSSQNKGLIKAIAYRHANRGAEGINTTVQKISATQYKVA